MSDSRARPSNSRSRLSCPPELPRKAPIPAPRNEVSLYSSEKLLDQTNNNSLDHIANVDKKQQKKQIFLVPPALKVLYLSKANERRYLEVNRPPPPTAPAPNHPPATTTAPFPERPLETPSPRSNTPAPPRTPGRRASHPVPTLQIKPRNSELPARPDDKPPGSPTYKLKNKTKILVMTLFAVLKKNPFTTSFSF